VEGSAAKIKSKIKRRGEMGSESGSTMKHGDRSL